MIIEIQVTKFANLKLLTESHWP